MKTIIRSENLQEMVQVLTYPHNFSADEPQTAVFVTPEYKGHSSRAEQTILNGVMIVKREVRIQGAPLVMEVEHDFPFLKMQFELEGYSGFVSSIGGVPEVEIPGGTHRLFFLPEVKGKLTFPHSRSTLEINLSLDFIYRLFNYDLKPLKKLGYGIDHIQPALAASRPMPIMPAMRVCIGDIFQCKFCGALKRIFLESKVSELLMLQLQQLEMAQNDGSVKLRQKDRVILFYVKELIEENIQNPLTIPELAQQAGMNETKLKQLFKQEFGYTLFEYLTDIRLTRAKALLEEDIYTIGHIASLIGYKHSQHFTHAFKKKFGMMPKNMFRTA